MSREEGDEMLKVMKDTLRTNVAEDRRNAEERSFQPNRNEKVLADFERYCAAHPEERFWQALRNWSGTGFIYASSFGPFVLGGASNLLHDTFGWEGKEAPKVEEKKGL